MNNQGGRVKTVATVIAVLNVIIALTGSITLFVISGSDESLKALIFFGLLVLVVGCTLAWIAYELIYAFGQLVENSDKAVFIMKAMAIKNGVDVDEKTMENNIRDYGVDDYEREMIKIMENDKKSKTKHFDDTDAEE